MNLSSIYKISLLLLLSMMLNAVHSQQVDQHQNIPTTRILFLLDASKSMSGTWQGEKKYLIARDVLTNILDSLESKENVQVALRVYGHLKHYPPQDCNDTRLEVAFGPDSFVKIKNRLKYIKPKGTSPIASSLSRTRTDFPDCDNCRNIIILITDGIEECGGDICQVSAELQKSGIILKPFIVGIGQDTKESFECAGTYFNAADKDQFTNTLKVIINKVLSRTSLQVNLLDSHNLPTETNVNLSFLNRENDKVMYNYVHTLNNKGVPDTMVVDPLINYRIIVNTKPPVIIDSVSLVEGLHNIVYADCPQGRLTVKADGNLPVDFNPVVLVNKAGTAQLLNNQYLSDDVKYLCGSYQVSILTLPITHIKHVEIEQNKTTTITIQPPGIASIQKSVRGYGSIYLLTKQGQEHIITLNENNKQAESLYLQPGTYRFVFRPIYAKQSVFTIEKIFTINSGITTRIKL